MKFHKYKISKEQLSLIPENERSFFLLSMIISDELNMLIRLGWDLIGETDNEVIAQLQNNQRIFSLFLVAGKLWDGWQSFEKSFFKSKLSKKYESLLTEEGKTSLGILKKYFSNKTNLHKIRNKYSFHYDLDEIKEQFREMDDDHIIEFFGQEKFVNRFSTTCTLSIEKILRAFDSDQDKAVDLFFEEIIVKTAINFRVVLSECIEIIIKEYFNDAEIIEIPNELNKETTRPYFFEKRMP